MFENNPFNFPILSLVVFFPAIAALFILFFVKKTEGEPDSLARQRRGVCRIPDLAAPLVRLRRLRAAVPVRGTLRVDPEPSGSNTAWASTGSACCWS